MSDEPLLEVRGLRTHLSGPRGVVKAVDGVDLHLRKGETLGIVGESGSGKSTLARTLLRLVPPTEGSIRFAGREWVGASQRELRPLRKRIQIVFQDPFSSLDPRLTIAESLDEALRIHGTLDRAARRARMVEVLEQVGLEASVTNRTPDAFSGGQRQRIALARALSVEPELLVLDEPLSALDVSLQAQLVNLLLALQRERGLAYLFISHDLRLVRHVSDRIAVMQAGRFVEEGDTDAVLSAPKHRHTQALLDSVIA